MLLLYIVALFLFTITGDDAQVKTWPASQTVFMVIGQPKICCLVILHPKVQILHGVPTNSINLPI